MRQSGRRSGNKNISNLALYSLDKFWPSLHSAEQFGVRKHGQFEERKNMTSETKHHRPFALKKPRSLRTKQPSVKDILLLTDDSKPNCEVMKPNCEAQLTMKDCQAQQNMKDCQAQQNTDDIKRIVLFTLQTKDRDELILTGWNAKSVWNAADSLRQSSGVEIVTMEIFSDKDDDAETEKSKFSGNGMCKLEKLSQKFSKRGVSYTKDDLIRLSQNECSKAPPPLWKLLIHTHSPCCLPAEKIKSYFEPSRFRQHDGTYVTN
ncbi:hypothetical protein Btru_046186 [Bulinus truncatus]|nr:hypothetical protein Btru_046186 [Bulinus truncatus]